MPALLASPHGPVPALHGEMARAYSQILQDRWRSIRRQGLTPSAPRRAAPRPCPRPGVLCGHSGRPRAARLGALGQWSHVLVVRGWRLLQAPGTPGPGGFNSLRLVAGCVGPGILLAGSGRQRPAASVSDLWALSLPALPQPSGARDLDLERPPGLGIAARRREVLCSWPGGTRRQRLVAAYLGAAPVFFSSPPRLALALAQGGKFHFGSRARKESP